MRFVTIWRTRAGSASAGGRGSEICRSRRWRFSSSRACMSAATSSTVDRRSTLRAWISNWPDSIRAMSSRSLTRSTSRSVDCRTIRMNSCWRSVRFSLFVDSSSSMKPLIDVSGLRSSCEAVATKSLLACSRRARSVMSRSVQTTPPSGPARRAAVIARALPSCCTMTSPASASCSDGSGLCGPCAELPGLSATASSRARGFIVVTRSPGSTMTSPSPRLSIVVARRWRWVSTRLLASARSRPIVLKASPSASSSAGPDASTRTVRSPAAIRRVAVTRSSSGRCIVRMSSVKNASTPTSARPALMPIARSAVRECDAARSRASLRRTCWRSASATTARRTASRSRRARARVASMVGWRASARASRCAGAIDCAIRSLRSSSAASSRACPAVRSKPRAAPATKPAVARERVRARLASSATVAASRFAVATSSDDEAARSSS